MASLLIPRWTPANDSAYCQESHVSKILAITGTFGLAALITVALRFYVRIKILKFVGADDYVMLSAAILTVGSYICFIGQASWGLGRHYTCLTPEDTRMYSKWQFYLSLWPMFGIITVKISVALFLMRLAPKRIWKNCLWGAIVFLVCFALASAGTLIFSCIPIAASWDIKIAELPTTKCFPNHVFASIGVFNSVINIVTDFCFSLIPIPIIIKLQVNTRTKITLAAILSLGLVACSAGIVKAHLQATFFSNHDPWWNDSFELWYMLELCLGIIAASLPSLKPLFASLLSTTKTALGLSSSGKKTGGASAYPGLSQASGYRRQYDPRNFNEILSDVDMDDMKPKGSNTIVVEARATADPITKKSKQKGGGGYNVRITSRDLTMSRRSEEERSWEDGPDISRNDSEERLHSPPLPLGGPGILRTMEVSRTSEAVRR